MMKRFKRILSLLMVTTVATGCFVGCGDNNNTGTSSQAKTSTADNTGKTSTAVNSEKTSTAENSEKSSAVENSEKKSESEVSYKDTKFRIAWWGSDARHNSTIALVEEFEKEYKDLKIEVEYASFNDYQTRINTQATGGELPDIIQVNYPWMNNYVDGGLLLPLDEFIADGSLDFSNVAESASGAGKIDGKMYAIVTGVNVPGIIYNPEILEQAGVKLSQTPTYDEYIGACKTVYDKTGARALTIPDLIYFARSRGEEIYAPGGKTVGFSQKTLVELFTTYADGIEHGYYFGPNDTDIETVDGLADGTLWCGSGFTNSFASNEKTAGKKLAFCAYPSTDANPNPSYLNPTMLWGISSTCKNPELAVKFLNYFVNNAKTYEITGLDRGLPISTAIRTQIAGSLSEADKEMSDFVSFIGDGHSTKVYEPFPAKATEAKDVYNEYLERVRYGTISRDQFETAAKECIDKMNTILGAE